MPRRRRGPSRGGRDIKEGFAGNRTSVTARSNPRRPHIIPGPEEDPQTEPSFRAAKRRILRLKSSGMGDNFCAQKKI
jgi:hypothetical protein